MVIYVAPFYLSSATRPSPTLTRDAPSSIRARTRAVTFSTITCAIITAFYLYRHDVSAYQLLHLFGIWPISILDSVRGMLLVSILFAGPLFENGVVDGDWRHWIKLQGVHETLSSWIGYRNFVVVSASFVALSLTLMIRVGSCQRRDRMALAHGPITCTRTLQ